MGGRWKDVGVSVSVLTGFVQAVIKSRCRFRIFVDQIGDPSEILPTSHIQSRIGEEKLGHKTWVQGGGSAPKITGFYFGRSKKRKVCPFVTVVSTYYCI